MECDIIRVNLGMVEVAGICWQGESMPVVWRCAAVQRCCKGIDADDVDDVGYAVGTVDEGTQSLDG